MSVHEVQLGFQWLKATLAADSTLTALIPGGIWQDKAPDGIAPPFVVMGYQAGSDTVTMNGVRVFVEVLYQVRASGLMSDGNVPAAAARLDQLIGNPPESGTITGGLVLSSYRETPLYLPELVTGQEWASFGGLYRLIIEQV